MQPSANQPATNPLMQLNVNREVVFDLSSSESRVIKQLVNVSNDESMTLTSIIDHDTIIDKSLLPKRADCAWLYGTKYWDMLDERQKMEVMWAEVGRDASMFIWLEQLLPPFYVGYVNNYREGFAKEIYEYFMIFAKEEIVHTLMFRKWLDLTHEQLWPAPSARYSGLLPYIPHLHPVIGVLWTLTVEWAAETNAIFQTQKPEVEPVTKKMFHEHHKEEVRHITFGRKMVSNWFENAPEKDKAIVRGAFANMLDAIIDLMTYNTDLQKRVSFQLPFDASDEAFAAEIRNSENNQRINSQRFAEQKEWYKQLGICHA
ncbi:diiron oxygenase [Acetobacteraceae bacterium ESL0709]|nr:diiron oxygenase [Acetobacteraceae bacterium ESL0697]MDF7678591.1 diiron oxygenase [Acetobacteraceae bacterium ESL0709]